jgi:protein SCO1/2
MLGMVLAVLMPGCASGPGRGLAGASCCRPAATRPGTAAEFHPEVLLDPSAQWTTDAGQPFSLVSLAGRPIIIAFFFAECHLICPVTVERMKGIEASLSSAERARTSFVLITITPDQDTPAALARYRRERALSKEHWLLLNGSTRAVQTAARALGVEVGHDATGRLVHGSEITLINSVGKVVAQESALAGDWDLFLARLDQVASGR